MDVAKLEDGKYEIHMDNGSMSFMRHGEPWRSANEDFKHVGLIYAAGSRVVELEAVNAQLVEALKRIAVEREGSDLGDFAEDALKAAGAL